MTSNSNGRQIVPGLWQLKSATFLVRVQKVDPRTGRKLNRARRLENVTRAQAMQAMHELRAELEALIVQPAPEREVITSSESLEHFAKSWLITKLDRNDLAPSTANRYAAALDHLGWLGDIPLSELTPRDVEQWMVAGKKRGYAPGTVNSWLRVIRAALSGALRDRLVSFNAAQQVRAFTVDVDLEDTNSLTNEELLRLLDALRKQDHNVHAAAWTQALTGLRWGEVSALKWEDLDEQARVLKIRRTVCERQLRPLTKTRKARIVGVPEVLISLLRCHLEQLVAEQHRGMASGLMFPSLRGTPLGSGRISDALVRARRDAGISTRFTSHGFRRTLTDLLRNAQVDPVVAAGLTGHETERMRRHYSTVRVADAVDAGDRVMRLLQPQVESPKESTPESITTGQENEPTASFK